MEKKVKRTGDAPLDRIEGFDILERELFGETLGTPGVNESAAAGEPTPETDFLSSLDEEMKRWETDLPNQSAPKPAPKSTSGVRIIRPPAKTATAQPAPKTEAPKAAAVSPPGSETPPVAPAAPRHPTPEAKPADIALRQERQETPEGRSENIALRQERQERKELVYPPLRVYLFEPNPLIRNTLEEGFRAEGIPTTVAETFGELLKMVAGNSLASSFAVVVLGSGDDVNRSLAAIAELKEENPHAAIFFLCDVGVSSLRKISTENGAAGFLEKPSMTGHGKLWDPRSMERFRKDVARQITQFYQFNKAYFDAVVQALATRD